MYGSDSISTNVPKTPVKAYCLRLAFMFLLLPEINENRSSALQSPPQQGEKRDARETPSLMNTTPITHLIAQLEQLPRSLGAKGIALAALSGVLLLLASAYLASRAKRRRLSIALATAEKELAETREQVERLRAADTRHRISQARLVTLLRSERRNSAEKLTVLEEARGELRLQFQALAQEIFEDKSATFSSQSKERLEALLQPFRQQITSLQNEIRQTYQHDTRERASLKQEILQLQELNRQINAEAINLTRALKGDKRVQGSWGELVLQRVLEQSGLRSGHEYETQQGYRNHDNRLFKPDVIIHLPEGKDVIVDSKVSLAAWERYCGSNEDDNAREHHLEELVRAVRNHIQSLGGKKYEELKGVKSLDFVLMFMPVEAAFLAAFSHDDRLFTEAFNQKIVVVTPTTLLAALRTIENLWRSEHQSRNSREIARRAGTLYDKFRGFVEDLEKIGKQLDVCRSTYSGAMNKLSQGRGNLIAQARQLTELGVQVKKELPRSVTEQADTEMKN